MKDRDLKLTLLYSHFDEVSGMKIETPSHEYTVYFTPTGLIRTYGNEPKKLNKNALASEDEQGHS